MPPSVRATIAQRLAKAETYKPRLDSTFGSDCSEDDSGGMRSSREQLLR